MTKFRWFWAWQDEAEETWLESMSQKGYHLCSVGLPGFYTFSLGEPRAYVYRLDYRTFRKKDKQEYLRLFADAGWEHIGEMSAWQYFRKQPRPNHNPEIFTDVESKVAKYKRVLIYLGFSYFWLAVILADLIYTGPVRSNGSYQWWGNVTQAGIALILLLFTYAIVMLGKRIRQMRKL